MRRIVIFAFGAFVGGFLASSAALLLAPSSGSRLRSQIQGYINQLGEDFKAASDQRRGELEKELVQLRATKSPSGD